MNPKIPLMNSAYLEEARIKLIAAVAVVSPYKLNADGDMMLMHAHHNTYQPFCKPKVEIGQHPNGNRVLSIEMVCQAEPFEGLGTEAEQREQSRQLYCLETAAVEKFMSCFYVPWKTLRAEKREAEKRRAEAAGEAVPAGDEAA